MKKTQSGEFEKFKLSIKKIKIFRTYFIVILIFGIIINLAVIFIDLIVCDFKPSITLLAVIGGIGTACCGSTIFYLRKLYKYCISNYFEDPQNQDEEKMELGIYLYYLLRPIFSVIFSILIFIGMKSSILVIVAKDVKIENGIIYINMFLSFFAGFASGDFITYLDKKGKNIFKKTFRTF